MRVDQDRGDSPARRAVSIGFSRVQDVVYVALGLLLSASAVVLLAHAGTDLARAVSKGVDARAIVALLDLILLALMVVELLYTVQVSFREHALVAEPFLLVALIATVRRILVIAAELGAQAKGGDQVFRQMLWELALLTVLTVVLVASVAVLRRASPAGAR